MINQRTRILNKKGECLRPYALKNYGIQYPKIELEKINLNPEFNKDDSFYRYVPTANPPLQLIGIDPNITNSSTQPIQIPLATQNNSQPSPSSVRNQKLIYSSPSPLTSVNQIKRNLNEDEDENLYFSQEKIIMKNPRR